MPNPDISASSTPLKDVIEALDRGLSASKSDAVEIVVRSTNEKIRVSQSFLTTLKATLDTSERADTSTPQQDMTTQQAADYLNVSRPYVVKLVDSGKLPGFKVGSHRRLRRGDVIKYKAMRDREAEQALEELTSLTEELGLY